MRSMLYRMHQRKHARCRDDPSDGMALDGLRGSLYGDRSGLLGGDHGCEGVDEE